jgi:hypothetical protein
MKDIRPSPLQAGIYGETNLFGFIVTVNFSKKPLDSKFEGQLESHVPEEVRSTNLTLTHEGVHFLHAMSTSYLYLLAVNLWNEIPRFTKYIKAMPVDQPIFIPSPALEQLRDLFSRLPAKSSVLSTPEIAGISPLDIIEGAAVFISDRMTLPDINHQQFLDRLARNYGTLPGVYCAAYRLADWYLGEDAFEVFSPLCFVALCTADPALTYCRLIQTLGRSGLLRRNKHPSVQEILGVADPADIKAARTAPEEIAVSGTHPVLTPYIEQFMEEHSEIAFAEFAARPYEFDDLNLFNYTTPPIVRFNDGHGLLARKLPKILPVKETLGEVEYRRQISTFLVHFAALCGAVLAAADGGEHYMQCPHTDCPHHSLTMCHAFAPLPPSYQECGFVKTFESVFGVPLQRIRRL